MNGQYPQLEVGQIDEVFKGVNNVLPNIPSLSSSSSAGAQGGTIAGTNLSQTFGKTSTWVMIGLVSVLGIALWRIKR